MLGGAVIGGVAGYLKTNKYAASNVLLAYTDCVPVSFVNGYARFVRPISDGGNFDQCNPGARLRFNSNAPAVNVLLRYNGLCGRTDSRNLIGEVYIDGVFTSNYSTPYAVNAIGPHRLNIVTGTVQNRLYEIVLPYADAVEFGGVEVDFPYTVTASAPKTGRLMVCYGDSITQGFWATETRNTWPFLLAAAKGFRCINMGMGGRQTLAGDGTTIANLNPDIITILMGHNDFELQLPPATTQANMQSLLANIHAINPNVPVYISAPINTLASLAIPMSSYQTAINNAVVAAGYSQLVSVPFGSLINTAHLSADGIHPTDVGNADMAAAWGAVIV